MHAHECIKAETNTYNLTKLNSAISKVIKKKTSIVKLNNDKK